MGICRKGTYFGTGQDEFVICFLDHVFLYDRLGKAWPARAGFKFIDGGKEWFARNHINLDAGFFIVPILVLEGGFCAVILCDVLLHIIQLIYFF